MPSEFIHVAADIRISFCFIRVGYYYFYNICIYIYIFHIFLSIHLTNRQIVCMFCLWWIMLQWTPEMQIEICIMVTIINIHKPKIMASDPITSCQIDGDTVEILSYFILGGSKITADGDCSHEIRRRLLLGRKVMTNLDSILKSRDITLPTKVHLVKAMVFPVVMHGCESWTVKNAERRKPDAFELWCWRRLFLRLQGDPTSPS